MYVHDPREPRPRTSGGIAIYDGDSFHTLSLAGRAGLLLLSLTLTMITALAARRIMRGRRLPLRMLIAFAVLTAFIWLSPQVYYAYYLTLFDGLPLQSVISSPPSPIEIAKILTFQDRPTLSAHGIALLGWLLITIAALQR